MKFLIILILCGSSIAAAQQAPVLDLGDQPPASFFGYVPNEITVKLNAVGRASMDAGIFRQGRTGIAVLDSILQRRAVKSILQPFPNAASIVYNGRDIDLSRWLKLRFADSLDVESFARRLSALPFVEKAEPIAIHAVSITPNDYNYASQWHLNQSNDADIDMPEAWEFDTGSSDVIVAILDTGVRYFHKDLGGANASYNTPANSRGNMWINTAELNGAGSVDDDANGYIDDWIGWDFVTGIASDILYSHVAGEDYDTPDNDPRDFNGHGTHCAGIVSAINNNGYAVAAPSGGFGNGTLQQTGNGVKVMPLRIGYEINSLFQGRVGLVRMDFAASAFYYAANNGANIVSCSWGSSNNSGLGDAIDYFLATGGIVFKSAGNDGDDSPDYMGNRTDVVDVAATDQTDCKASFSDYGTWVDISSPGVSILSTYHLDSDPTNDYVASISGTSMACPLAASVAALIWSHRPSWTAAQVLQKLYDSADPIDALACNVAYAGKLGAGRINARDALTVPLAAKLFLQGPFDNATARMSTALNDAGSIPTTSPYPDDPRTVAAVPDSVVDWVLVQIKSTVDGAAVASRSAFLHRRGYIADDDGNTFRVPLDAVAGDYYVQITHRNHLTATSANLHSLMDTGTTLYDFSTGLSPYLIANAAVEITPSIWGAAAGDINQDGFVTTTDYRTWYNANYGSETGYRVTDLNLDGTLDADDYQLWYENSSDGAASSP